MFQEELLAICSSTVVRLANDFANVVAIKEAAGDMATSNATIKKQTRRFSSISGDDMIVYQWF
jgi:4-hydroxy-tetrahydrodipicolinate synthase